MGRDKNSRHNEGAPEDAVGLVAPRINLSEVVWPGLQGNIFQTFKDYASYNKRESLPFVKKIKNEIDPHKIIKAVIDTQRSVGADPLTTSATERYFTFRQRQSSGIDGQKALEIAHLCLEYTNPTYPKPEDAFNSVAETVDQLKETKVKDSLIVSQDVAVAKINEHCKQNPIVKLLALRALSYDDGKPNSPLSSSLFGEASYSSENLTVEDSDRGDVESTLKKEIADKAFESLVAFVASTLFNEDYAEFPNSIGFTANDAPEKITSTVDSTLVGVLSDSKIESMPLSSFVTVRQDPFTILPTPDLIENFPAFSFARLVIDSICDSQTSVVKKGYQESIKKVFEKDGPTVKDLYAVISTLPVNDADGDLKEKKLRNQDQETPPANDKKHTASESDSFAVPEYVPEGALETYKKLDPNIRGLIQSNVESFINPDNKDEHKLAVFVNSLPISNALKSQIPFLINSPKEAGNVEPINQVKKILETAIPNTESHLKGFEVLKILSTSVKASELSKLGTFYKDDKINRRLKDAVYTISNLYPKFKGSPNAVVHALMLRRLGEIKDPSAKTAMQNMVHAVGLLGFSNSDALENAVAIPDAITQESVDNFIISLGSEIIKLNRQKTEKLGEELASKYFEFDASSKRAIPKSGLTGKEAEIIYHEYLLAKRKGDLKVDNREALDLLNVRSLLSGKVPEKPTSVAEGAVAADDENRKLEVKKLEESPETVTGLDFVTGKFSPEAIEAFEALPPTVKEEIKTLTQGLLDPSNNLEKKKSIFIYELPITKSLKVELEKLYIPQNNPRKNDNLNALNNFAFKILNTAIPNMESFLAGRDGLISLVKEVISDDRNASKKLMSEKTPRPIKEAIFGLSDYYPYNDPRLSALVAGLVRTAESDPADTTARLNNLREAFSTIIFGNKDSLNTVQTPDEINGEAVHKFIIDLNNAVQKTRNEKFEQIGDETASKYFELKEAGNDVRKVYPKQGLTGIEAEIVYRAFNVARENSEIKKGDFSLDKIFVRELLGGGNKVTIASTKEAESNGSAVVGGNESGDTKSTESKTEALSAEERVLKYFKEVRELFEGEYDNNKKTKLKNAFSALPGNISYGAELVNSFANTVSGDVEKDRKLVDLFERFFKAFRVGPFITPDSEKLLKFTELKSKGSLSGDEVKIANFFNIPDELAKKLFADNRFVNPYRPDDFYKDIASRPLSIESEQYSSIRKYLSDAIQRKAQQLNLESVAGAYLSSIYVATENYPVTPGKPNGIFKFLDWARIDFEKKIAKNFTYTAYNTKISSLITEFRGKLEVNINGILEIDERNQFNAFNIANNLINQLNKSPEGLKNWVMSQSGDLFAGSVILKTKEFAGKTTGEILEIIQKRNKESIEKNAKKDKIFDSPKTQPPVFTKSPVYPEIEVPKIPSHLNLRLDLAKYLKDKIEEAKTAYTTKRNQEDSSKTGAPLTQEELDDIQIGILTKWISENPGEESARLKIVRNLYRGADNDGIGIIDEADKAKKEVISKHLPKYGGANLMYNILPKPETANERLASERASKIQEMLNNPLFKRRSGMINSMLERTPEVRYVEPPLGKVIGSFKGKPWTRINSMLGVFKGAFNEMMGAMKRTGSSLNRA